MIILFSNALCNTIGGLEIFNEELKKIFNKRNIDYFHATSRTKNKIINYIERYMKTVKFISKNKPNVNFVLVQYGNFLDILILPFLKLINKHIIVIVHVSVHWKHIKNKYSLWFVNKFLQIFVNEIFIITEEQRHFLSHKKLFKIHTIINEDYFLFKKKILNEKYFLFLGRICVEKGIEDLLYAYNILLKKNKNIPKLKIVGPVSKKYLVQIVIMVKNLGIQKNVTIESPIYDIDKKITLIDNAELVIYPSYIDAFPLTVIESFARGVVCISTNLSETDYFVEFNEFKIHPGDIYGLVTKIQNYLNSKNSYKNKILYMKRKALKYARGKIIEEIYEAVGKC